MISVGGSSGAQCDPNALFGCSNSETVLLSPQTKLTDSVAGSQCTTRLHPVLNKFYIG
jgi:hypothetical protein